MSNGPILSSAAAATPPVPLQTAGVPILGAAQPDVAIIMEGVIQVRFPASKTTQMLFDLALPAGKEKPGTLAYVNDEAKGVAPAAMKVFQDMLRQSPGLQAVDGNIVLAYAVDEGKLRYVFQLGVRTR